MIVIDSSALIRLFTNDIPTKATIVKNLLQSDEIVVIPDIVFSELDYVLCGKVYRLSRKEILVAFRFLLSLKRALISKEVKLAVALYNKTKLDMSDCIIVASSFEHELLSFDEEMMKVQKSLRS